MDLKEAIDILSKTKDPLYMVALGLKVDAAEAAQAFANAKPDTADYVCLKILTEVHKAPVIIEAPVIKTTAKTVKPAPEA